MKRAEPMLQIIADHAMSDFVTNIAGFILVPGMYLMSHPALVGGINQTGISQAVYLLGYTTASWHFYSYS